jgi:hypothetical protein
MKAITQSEGVDSSAKNAGCWRAVAGVGIGLILGGLAGILLGLLAGVAIAVVVGVL